MPAGVPTLRIAVPCLIQAFSSFPSPRSGISAWMSRGGVVGPALLQGEVLWVLSPQQKAGPEASSQFCDNPNGNLRGKGLCLSICGTTEVFDKSWGIQGSGRADDEVIPCLSSVPRRSPPHSIGSILIYPCLEEVSLILTHRNLQQLQELPKEWLLESSGSKLKHNCSLGCRPPACPIPWFPLCRPDLQGIAEPELGSFTWMSSWCRLTHFANQGGNQMEKTKGTSFQSHFVPLCSTLVCLEQLGFVLGRAVTPKTRQEMGRARVVS